MLDDTSSQYASINTHKGLYKYTHLPHGVASFLAIFQKMMEFVLQRIPNVVCYIDDILIKSKSDDEHLKIWGSLWKTTEVWYKSEAFKL